jgi:hypothetical protein
MIEHTNGNGRQPRGDSERRAMLERVYTSGNRFQVNTDLMAFLPLDLAVVLSYLITVAHLNRAEERSGGWFYCKMTRFRKVLYMNHSRQARIVAALKSRGLITTKMKGLPAKRYFLIDYDRIYENATTAIREWQEKSRKKP